MEKGKQREGIGFFEKYLTVWVLICMAAGILIGKFLPAVPVFWDALSMHKYPSPSPY